MSTVIHQITYPCRRCGNNADRHFKAEYTWWCDDGLRSDSSTPYTPPRPAQRGKDFL